WADCTSASFTGGFQSMPPRSSEIDRRTQTTAPGARCSVKDWFSQSAPPGVNDIQYCEVTLKMKRERTSKGMVSRREETSEVSAMVVVTPPAGGTAPAAEA